MPNENKTPDFIAETLFANEYEATSKWLDKAWLLAARIALLGPDTRFIPSELVQEASELNNTSNLQEFKVVFSGDGLIAVADSDGDVVTGMCRVKNVRGEPLGISIGDFRSMDHIYKPPSIEDSPKGVMIDSSNEYYSEYTSTIPNLIETPKNGPTLIMDILLDTEYSDDDTGGEKEIAGPCVTTPVVNYRAQMDMSKLVIESLRLKSLDDDPRGVDMVSNIISVGSKYFFDTFRDTSFRRLVREKQRVIVEQSITKLNELAGLDKFDALLAKRKYDKKTSKYTIAPLEVYTVFQNVDDRVIIKKTLKDFGDEMPCHLLRFGCLDTYDIQNTQNKPIRSNESMVDPEAGLYLVAMVEDDFAATSGLMSNVVWVPIGKDTGIYLERRLNIQNNGM